MLKILKTAEDSKNWLDSMTAIVEKNGQGTNMDNYTAIVTFLDGAPEPRQTENSVQAKSQKYRISEKQVLGDRADQQDALYSFYDDKKEELFAVICDGMGGAFGGKEASSIAINKLIELHDSKMESESPFEFFDRALDIIDNEVAALKEKDEKYKKAGTTLVSVIIENDELYYFSVGDSPLYLIRNNKIKMLTREHNVKFAKDEGLAIYKNLKNYSDDTLISFIGKGGIDIYDLNKGGVILERDDILLLTSDGLTKILSDEELKGIILEEEFDNALQKLFSETERRAKGKRDNTTAILIKVGSKSDEK
jgi:protein phosphatase